MSCEQTVSILLVWKPVPFDPHLLLSLPPAPAAPFPLPVSVCFIQNQILSGNYLSIYVYQIIMLYTLRLCIHHFICNNMDGPWGHYASMISLICGIIYIHIYITFYLFIHLFMNTLCLGYCK